MDNQIDITKITDVKELKALAFDTIGRIEVEQQNLRILQSRILELQNAKTEAAVRTTDTLE